MAQAAAAMFNRGMGSAGKDNTMRGLVSFIADLRNARARELEEKRINKELANIRWVLQLVPQSPPRLTALQAKVQRYFSDTLPP